MVEEVKYDTDKILSATCHIRDFDEVMSVRDYLKELLLTLWDEGDGFSGKRPWGNSGWYSDLAPALGNAGLLEVKYDEEGYIEDYDDEAYDQMIQAAIKAL